MRVRSLHLCLAALTLLAGPLTGAGVAADAPPGYSIASRQTVAPGLEYLRMKSSLPESVYVAHLSPGAGQQLRMVQANGKIAQSSSALKTPDVLCRSVGCSVAVNGDFFQGGQPLGAVVTGGVLLRSPGAGHQQFWIGPDGALGAGFLGFSGRLDGSGGAVTVNGVNVDRGKDSITVYTAAYGSKTPKGKGLVEVVAQAADPGQVGRLGVAAALSLTQLVKGTVGGTPIPPGAIVISAQGKGGTAAVQALWARRASIGSALTLTLNTSPAVRETIGVNPVMLVNGQPVYPRSGSFITSREPRTVFGWNRAGDVWFVAVDGRQPSSKGWTIAEAAAFVAGLGATYAVNFDGGGGTTFVVNGNVMNSPSDNINAAQHKPGTVRRAVSILAAVGG